MQCHKPGHRASARCVSALLAATALLATAADQLGGSRTRPVTEYAASEVPSALSPASLSVLLAGLDQRPAEHLLARTTVRIPISGFETAVGTPRPPVTMADPSPWPRHLWHGMRWTHRWRHGYVRKAHHGSRVRPGPDSYRGAPIPAHLPAAANAQAAIAVREAFSLLGVPYRWGGTTRAGFDCSGFTQHVWAAAGIKIPRTVRAQARMGHAIPLNQAQPGDLVVFYPTRHHVGLYVGNNLVVDAPHTGSWVRTDPVRSMPVSVVVRLTA
jgi:cell wall-associated NlpC family hydrolase